MVARLRLSDSPQVARLTENEASRSLEKTSLSACVDPLIRNLGIKESHLARLPQPKRPACSSPAQTIRRVRFASDENGCIQEEVYTYKAVSERRKERYYTSRAELQQMMNDAHEFAQAHIEAHPEWLNHVESLLLNSPLSADDEDLDINEMIRLVSVSDARGLEFCSPLLQKHQAWAVQSVLRRHRQLTMQGEPELATLLRERCERVNRFTREMALRVAKGDALEAEVVYESATSDTASTIERDQ